MITIAKVDTDGYPTAMAQIPADAEFPPEVVSKPMPNDMFKPRWDFTSEEWFEEEPWRGLETTKSDKKSELNSRCEALIVSGFTSDALGTTHTYQSDRDDQMNLIGVVSGGTGGHFKCTDSQGVTAFVPHTAEQMSQVLQDGHVRKLQILQYCAQKKLEVDNTTTEAEVDAIVWEMS